MGLLTCFCSIKEKKDTKVQKSSVKPADKDNNAVKTLHVKLENLEKAPETKELRSTSFTVPVPFSIHGGSRCKVKVMSHDSPIATDPVEVNYEGGDEHDDCSPMKRDDSDFDLQNYIKNPNEEDHQDLDITCSPDDFEFITSGHVSDPGKDKREFWSSPKLKRSCSSLDMRNISKEFIENHALLKSKSYENIQRLSGMQTDEILPRDVASPLSVMTHRSADKVMLKRRSSSQILPSRSRRLWWKLLLWSHRNNHLSETTKRQDIEIKHPDLHNKRGGYSSDTVEPFQAMGESMFTSPNSFSAKFMDKGKSKLVDKSWDGFYGATGTWPQNQWVAFPSNLSPLARVDEWVKEVSSLAPCEIEYHDDEIEKEITFPPSPEKDTEQGYAHLSINLPEEILHANRVIQSLNASSTVAHITAIGLKVVPSISHFTSLRSVNLSGNSIVHITSGSLPKGLHVLDLSRNKINAIEGLRELTRLWVLDLSYNRISRIGQGLSSCTIIKELYLAGNKISGVEGLHRLLKLTVLDLSFNKITTTKALGQLVANYNSLIALNLLGNPIQSNISDDQMRKTLCSLLPKLAFLNKQPITPKKARDVHANAIARAALGSGNKNNRRKGVKRVSNQGGSSSSPVVRRSNASAAGGGTERGSKHRSRNHSIRHVASSDKIHQSPVHRLEE